jgi:hypothetical protein
MALSVRITPIRRDLDVMFKQGIGDKAQSALLAAFALEKIEEAKAQNKQALGRVPPYKTYVDGREGAPLESVKPNGVIRVEFQLVNEAIAWIYQQLQIHSPVLTGRYANSHELFADGVQVDNPNAAPPAEEYVFLNTQPYARKIEGDLSREPSSRQAPEGVYEAVATLAQNKFSRLGKIRFSYRTPIGGQIAGGRIGDRSKRRTPAIIVTLR